MTKLKSLSVTQIGVVAIALAFTVGIFYYWLAPHELGGLPQKYQKYIEDPQHPGQLMRVDNDDPRPEPTPTN